MEIEREKTFLDQARTNQKKEKEDIKKERQELIEEKASFLNFQFLKFQF